MTSEQNKQSNEEILQSVNGALERMERILSMLERLQSRRETERLYKMGRITM